MKMVHFAMGFDTFALLGFLTFAGFGLRKLTKRCYFEVSVFVRMDVIPVALISMFIEHALKNVGNQ